MLKCRVKHSFAFLLCLIHDRRGLEARVKSVSQTDECAIAWGTILCVAVVPLGALKAPVSFEPLHRSKYVDAVKMMSALGVSTPAVHARRRMTSVTYVHDLHVSSQARGTAR